MGLMSKQQYPTPFVMAGLIAILASAVLVVTVGSTIPQASADPRFPQPEFHCFGNPHSDEPTGNPHDIGINDKSNPHDQLRSEGGECELNPHSPK